MTSIAIACCSVRLVLSACILKPLEAPLDRIAEDSGHYRGNLSQCAFISAQPDENQPRDKSCGPAVPRRRGETACIPVYECSGVMYSTTGKCFGVGRRYWPMVNTPAAYLAAIVHGLKKFSLFSPRPSITRSLSQSGSCRTTVPCTPQVCKDIRYFARERTTGVSVRPFPCSDCKCLAIVEHCLYAPTSCVKSGRDLMTIEGSISEAP